MGGNRDLCCPQWDLYKIRESLMKKVMSELSVRGPSGSQVDRAPGRGNDKGGALRSECAWCDGNTELEMIDKALSFTDRSDGNQASPREMSCSEGSRCQEGNTDEDEAPKGTPGQILGNSLYNKEVIC